MIVGVLMYQVCCLTVIICLVLSDCFINCLIYHICNMHYLLLINHPFFMLLASVLTAYRSMMVAKVMSNGVH